MKAKLIKTEKHYMIKMDGVGYITDYESTLPYKLSKQNCDEIFGIVDVEKLAYDFSWNHQSDPNYGDTIHIFTEGFNKAMKLNKDKVFTLEDVILIAEYVRVASQSTPNERTKNLVDEYLYAQQPTEIEVEIEMECPQCQEWGFVSECRNDCNKKFLQPKLDSEGCLTLKKL